MKEETPHAPRRPRADALRNRDRLIHAASEVFRRDGEAATLETVARQAGVGIGTLYRHFPTRHALFEAVYRREVDELALLADRIAGDDDPMDGLRRWIRACIDLVATKKGMLTALTLAVDPASDVYAYSHARLSAAIGTLLGQARTEDRIRSDVSAEDVLHTIIGMCLVRSHPGWQDDVFRLVDIFLDGLRTGARG